MKKYKVEFNTLEELREILNESISAHNNNIRNNYDILLDSGIKSYIHDTEIVIPKDITFLSVSVDSLTEKQVELVRGLAKGDFLESDFVNLKIEKNKQMQ